MTVSTDQFYVVAREPGAEHPALPTWACRQDNPLALIEAASASLTRKEVADLPGAFQILNVLSREECAKLIALGESLGYLPDAAVSLPRSVRQNDNVVWVTDSTTDQIIWQRINGLIPKEPHFSYRDAAGINARFRFYRYAEGDFFRPHTDGAWPGSRVIDGELITDAYPDRFSD